MGSCGRHVSALHVIRPQSSLHVVVNLHNHPQPAGVRNGEEVAFVWWLDVMSRFYADYFPFKSNQSGLG